VFQDLFLPNLAIFVLGLGAALFWLRTGMVRRGMMLMALLVTAADIALVARFVNENRGLSFVAALVALQVCALGSSGWLLFKLSRRRWGADSRQRDQLLNAAFKHYLRDELRPAGDLFRRLRAADPWDVAATIGLANVCRRQGSVARARSLYRRARRLDRRSRRYGDLIAEQLRRCQQRRGRPAGLTSDVAGDAAAEPGPLLE